MTRKTKVAILGGGVGAISAAYQLTSFPDWQDRFEITLYQMGWRLGGKCASGRSLDPSHRIEEHGLHVWHGFYDNAIRQMRDCYAQAQPHGGVFKSFAEAFTPFNNITLTEQVDGQWLQWNIQPPRNDETAGSGGLLLSPWEYCKQALAMLRQMSANIPDVSKIFTEVLPEALSDTLRTQLRSSVSAALGARPRLHHLADFAGSLPARISDAHEKAVLELIVNIEDELREAFGSEFKSNHELRRFMIATDLVLAAIAGIIKDEVITRGFDAIDDVEISAWLAKHGAQPDSLDSALVRGIYDYAFGFAKGLPDAAHRSIAAGTSLRGLCRMSFTYKDAYFFKMMGGMGDTVFTPYYKVLKARGVKFCFFHKVTQLKTRGTSHQIDRILIQRQAEPAGSEYDPLITVGTLDCWPAEPLWSQLKHGDQLRAAQVNFESSWSPLPPQTACLPPLELKLGQDFDKVILGIPIGALRGICSDLATADPQWDKMLTQVQTTRTMACQLWLQDDLEDLGWKNGPTILCSYADNLNTWADMSHLLRVERWPREGKPRSVAYFCGPLADDPAQPDASDHGYPEQQRLKVRDHARQWLKAHIGTLWENFVDSKGEPCWDALAAAGGGDRQARFQAQYFRANIDPSERYVLSVPGSMQYRLRSDQSGFQNLFLAGDWTHNGVNAGCVEAAVMSGMRAAAGLAGEEVEITGEWDLARGPADGKRRPPDLVSLRAQNQEWPWSSMYGMAQTSGANAVFALPRAVVAKTLGFGLELAPQDMTDGDEHPVILLFGWQDAVRPNRLPFSGRYLEFIYAVPFVQHADKKLHEGCPGPFIYMPQLYLDSVIPTLLGIFGYGYNKSMANIRADSREYVVSDRRSGSPIVSCSFKPAGNTGSEVDFKHFRITRKPYELPLISKTPLGGWHYSFYDFALGQALIQPISMSIQIHNTQVGGLPPGTHNIPSIQQKALGAFFVSTDATISNPMQSRHLAAQIKARREQGRPPLLPF